jgi:hypothetical protein
LGRRELINRIGYIILPTVNGKRLLTQEEVCELYPCIKLWNLKYLRFKKKGGPRFVRMPGTKKFGNKIIEVKKPYYKPEDVEAWLDEYTFETGDSVRISRRLLDSEDDHGAKVVDGWSRQDW